MARRNLSAIRQVVRQLLRDEFDPDVTGEWEDDEIDVHIEAGVGEISAASPHQSRDLLLTTADSKILDISGIDNLMRVRFVEYPMGGSPRNFHNIEILDSDTIEMKVDSLPGETGAKGTLTGTVTFTANSPTVTGSGTDFDGELEAGYFIKPSTKDRWYRIASVDSDTELTLEELVKGEDAGADTVDSTEYTEENVAIAYCDKLHTLSEEESTLLPQHESALILYVCGHTAISKSRSLINTVNIGGGNTAQRMESWGLTKLQFYQSALKKLTPLKANQSYPSG